jgi:tRNA pseudouridine-54 N-methylase
MIFLVISQRAKANPQYNLKDLPGHGRIDVIFRCILAATRELTNDPGHPIYIYLKGSEPQGYLHIDFNFVSSDDDEISIAAKIQDNWDQLFTLSSLEALLSEIDFDALYLLSEDGELLTDIKIRDQDLILLGAQNDLVEADLEIFNQLTRISLTQKSLLASQAITFLRQQLLY